MPRVTTYGGRQVATAPLPGARLRSVPSPESFGAGLGETAANIGSRLYSAVADHERDKADQIALLNADGQLAAWENQRLYDPQNGALAVKGKDTFGLPETINDEFDKTANTIAEGLKTDRQRDSFARTRANRQQDIDLTIRRHVFGQMQEYDQSETKAFLELSQSNAVANANDPRRVGEELSRSIAAVKDYAVRQGVGPEQTGLQVQAVQSSIHSGVIDRLLALDQDKAASAYYAETKDQISGEARARIDKALEEGSLRGESQRRSDAIMVKATTQEDAIDQAQSIEDPKLRDEVQNRVVTAWSLKKQADREQHEQVMVTSANLIDQHPGRGIRAIPPSTWTALSIQERASLEAYAKRNASGDTEGKTDMVTYYGLLTQASTEPAKFSQTNLLMYLPKLAKTEFKQLAEIQGSIRKGDRAKTDEQLDGFRTNEQIVADTLDLNQIPRTGPDADPELVARFRRTVDEQVSTLQRLTGKKASNEDVQRIADDLLTRGVTVPNSWFQRLLGNTVTGKRLLSATIDDVPATARTQIEDSLRRHSVPVSDQSILQAYIDQQLREGRK